MPIRIPEAVTNVRFLQILLEGSQCGSWPTPLFQRLPAEADSPV